MPRLSSPGKAFLPWINDAGLRNIAVVGICKNAGKTTLLNAVLRHYPHHAWGVLSTGRDGETTDVIFKTPKPRVQLNPGNLFCADARSLEEHGSAISIIAKTPWLRGGKRLYIARSTIAIATEISGPGTAKAQSECAELMHCLGAGKVIIDGALDRKSVVLSGAVDAIILVAGASFGSIQEIVTELERLQALATIPQASIKQDDVANRLLDSKVVMLKQKGRWIDTEINSLIGREKELLELLAQNAGVAELYIPGVYSTGQHHKLGEQLKDIRLVFRNPECIKLPHTELDALLKGYRVACLIEFKIKAMVINSTGVGSASHDADAFRTYMRQTCSKLEMHDLWELS